MYQTDRPLSADLMLAREPVIQVAALTEMLNDIMGPAGLVFERAECAAVVLTAQRLHLCLEPRDTPLPRDRLSRAEVSSYGDVMGEDWSTLIRRHSAALTLTVHPGSGPEDRPDVDEELQELMLSVAHVTTTYLANQATPLAVHWAPTGQIFTPVRLMAMADMLFPLPLFVHPVPESTGRTDGETQVVGFRLMGTEDLIGLPLRMREAPARLDWLVERALAFVDHARAAGGPIPPGDTFGCADGESFDVTEDPETGGLALTLKERDGILVLQPEPLRPSEAA